MGKQALEGVKVTDFTWSAVGPIITKYLSDHGATVVRIESHTRPCPLRVSAPFKDGKPGIDRSGFFADHNSSKYGLSLDLNKPRGREIAWKMVMWADVIVENFTPGAMAKWGLEYESVKKVRPDVVYISVSMEGQHGPASLLPGYGPIANSIAGLYHLSGWPDRGPVPPWGAYSDYVTPRFGLAAALSALDYRQRTGKGQYIDLSQIETTIHVLAPSVMDYVANGRVENRQGNRLDCAAPHGVYPCLGEERWCAIAIFTDSEWRSFARTLGEPGWITDPKFSTMNARKENEEELDRLIAGWTTERTAEQVEASLQAANVASAVVNNGSDLFADPQLKHRGGFRFLEHSVIGRHAYTGPAFRLSKTPDRQFAAPALGQHNTYVCKEILGLTDDQVADLMAEHVITTENDLPGMKALL